jgi:UDP-N-acetylmuramoyl-L-alanyl-D-glutamate--2,6-diaminopimelate ligase
MEEYFETKKTLFRMTRCAIVNTDDEYGKRLFSELNIKKISFGIFSDADAYIDDYESLGLSGSAFKFKSSDRQINIRLHLPGSYNIYNALAAITVASDMEISPFVIRDTIRDTRLIEGRFQILSDLPTVIADYAHTAYAFQSFLHELDKLKGDRRLTVIFGCGGDRDKGKRKEMGSCAEQYADKIILTNDNPRSETPMDIIRDILEGIKSKPVYIDTNRERVVEEAVISAEKNDIVAVVGKGVEKYYIDRSGYHKYDEIALIRSALDKRSKNDENKA